MSVLLARRLAEVHQRTWRLPSRLSAQRSSCSPGVALGICGHFDFLSEQARSRGHCWQELRVYGQSLAQLESLGFRAQLDVFPLRPGRLRVDEIGRERRNTGTV